ncbi:MAG: transporter [Bryobacterales bacterium]|nr:transporter [Bryobacterales bacterium]
MATSTLSPKPVQWRPTPLHWFALALLTISVGINYLDRGNLSVALSSIEREVHLSKDQLGLLGTAFFVTYSLLQIVAGKLIDRFNVNWVYAAGFFLWSGVTALTGFARDVHVLGFTLDAFAVLFILRMLLGCGESVAYPAYAKILAGSFPERLRGTANAAIDVGSKIGPAIGIMLGIELVQRLSWRGMFIAIGVVSMVWLLPWCLVAGRLTLRQDLSPMPAPSYREIMSKRPFWGTVLGLFGGNYTWYFFLTWLPYYFEHERHYTHDRLAFFSSLPFWGVGLSAMTAGLVSDALIRSGRQPLRVRQGTVCLGLLGCCGFMLPAVLIQNEALSLSFLMVACLLLGLWSSNHWALTQTLSGARAAGKWTGLQNCMGNFAGVAAPWITGSILGATHQFFFAFAVSCIILLLSTVGYWFIVGKCSSIEWSTQETPVPVSGQPQVR